MQWACLLVAYKHLVYLLKTQNESMRKSCKEISKSLESWSQFVLHNPVNHERNRTGKNSDCINILQ